MTNHRRDAPPLDQVVLRWSRYLREGNPRVREAFATFVRRSPRHLTLFLQHKLLDVELTGLDPEGRIDVTPFIARARSRGNVISSDGSGPAPPQLHTRSRTGSPLARRIGVVAMTIAVSALGLGPLFMQWHSTCQTTYATHVGQRQQIRLPDGSTMNLNTQSRVEVDFTPGKREVRLVEGEVLFTVRYDRRQPFRVRIGQTWIQDFGTQFNVRIRADCVSVSVIEGHVGIMSIADTLQQVERPRGAEFAKRSVGAKLYAPVDLAARDEAVIAPHLPPGRPRTLRLSPEEVSARTSWTQGLVTFTGQTLVEAVAEMNRYNRVRIELVDPNIANLRLGGTFNVTDVLGFVETLEHLGVTSDAKAVMHTDSAIIHLRRSTPRSA